jgi:hypothetical protein
MANRKNTFILKRSNVPGKVPSSGDLILGELAINTADVILYASGTTANSILPIGWDRVARTGDTMTGQLNVPTISATTYLGLPIDVRVTGGTYNPSTGIATFTNNTGGTFTVTGFNSSSASTASYITGFTYNNANTFTLTDNSGATLSATFNIVTGLTATSVYTNYFDFNTSYTGLTQVGRLNWDDGEGTLTLGLKGGNVNLQLGKENVILVYNDEPTPLIDGEVVYVSGSQGNKPKVKRALATSDGYSVTTLGVVTEPIGSGSEGFVTTFGLVNNLNTSGYTGGTALWLSPTVAGALTDVKPQAPYHTVLIGYAVRIDNTVGSVFVNISNGWEIDELHDVRITNKQDGDILTLSAYSGNSVWVNSKTLTGSYNLNGDLTFSGSVRHIDYLTFNSGYTQTGVTESKLYWDEPNGTLTLGLHSDKTSLQIGQESFFYIKNVSGSTINKGRVVFNSGVDTASGKLTGEYMIADGTINSILTLGIASHDITNGDFGYVNAFGVVNGINTSGSLYGETWNDGDTLYVSPNIYGGLTRFQPNSPNLKIMVGVVLTADSANGSIFVRPMLGEYFNNLHDVSISGENNYDIVQYNAALSVWENTNKPYFNELTAVTISASTYYGLPSDITGFTYTPNTFTIANKNGEIFNATINTVTGLTVNGNLDVTGTVNTNNINATGGTSLFRTIEPLTDNTYVLGSTSKTWSNLHTREIRLYDSSGNDSVSINAPSSLSTSPDPAWSITLPTVSGGTFSLLGVYSGVSNVSNTSWFTLSGGSNVNIGQVASATGSVLTLSATDTYVTGVTVNNGILSIQQNNVNAVTASTLTSRELVFNSNSMTLNTATRSTLTPLVMSVTRFDGTGPIDDAGLSFVIPSDYISSPQFYFVWRAASTGATNAKIFIDLYTGSTNNLGSLTTPVETLNIIATPTNLNTFIISSAVTSSISFSGGNTVHARIYRDPSDGGDTYTGSLDMINFNFKYNSIR